jgi:protein-S-isoprenylcysteine O-methyltransferase Ste14
MPFNLVMLVFLWIVFCVLHSLLASIRVKQGLQQRLGKSYSYYRLAYTIFAFITLAGVVLYQLSLPTEPFFQPPHWLVITGYIISGAGLLLMLVCIRKYFMGLSGLRSLFQERPAHDLIITGVHRFVRHPLYLGTFGFLWGMLPVFPFYSLLISNSVITIYTLMGIRLEEEKLIGEFGEDYRRYRREVPMLLPHPRRARG